MSGNKQHDISTIFTNLALEGGGVLGSAYVGAARKLFLMGKLQNIKNYAGSSVGAIVAALMACGADIKFLSHELTSLDFNSFKDDTWGIVRDIYRIFYEYGYCQGDALMTKIEELIKKLIGHADITFKQLYEKNGNTLIVTGTNLDKRTTTYFSRISYPDMPIALAVRISSSFPLFFRAVKFNGDTYVDGGLLDNYPFHAFEKINSLPNYTTEHNTIGLKLLSAEEFKGITPKVTNIKYYIEALIFSMYDQSLKKHVSNDDWEYTIKINVGEISSMDFAIKDNDKLWLESQGEIAVDLFFTNGPLMD